MKAIHDRTPWRSTAILIAICCLVGIADPASAEPPTESAVEIPRSASPVPDDGGADAVCGADRRCRIERLAARNRLHRQYDATQQQAIIDEEIATIQRESRQENPKTGRPLLAAYHIAPYGHGLLLGRTIAGRLRPELTVLTQDEWVRGGSFNADVGSFNERHHFRSLGAHLTLIAGSSIVSPLISVGAVFARGTLGDRRGFGSNWQADVEYHLVVGSAGMELQLDTGFYVRLVFTYGRLLYNQVRYGPGNYDDTLRPLMRNHMHSDGLPGPAFSLGWTF